MKPAQLISGFTAVIAVSLLITSPSSAKTLKGCEEEWKANKVTIQASGKKKKDFIAECRAETTSNEPAAAQAAPATASSAPTSAEEPKSPATHRTRFEKTLKACAEEWTANKETLQAAGRTRKDFITECHTGASASGSPLTTTQTAAPSRETTANAATAGRKTVKACESEWKENKAAIQASGKKKTDFMTECRAEPVANRPATASPAPAPAAQPQSNATAEQPKPQPSEPRATPTKSAVNSLQPASPATSKPEANSVKPTSAPIPSLTAGEFATEAEAKTHCPQDTVVWANTRSKIYHYATSHQYGHTKAGAYMCEKDTAAAGIRAAKREKRS